MAKSLQQQMFAHTPPKNPKLGGTTAAPKFPMKAGHDNLKSAMGKTHKEDCTCATCSKR